MKNYDEITNDLLKRRDTYVIQRKKRMKKVIGGAALACCFTAVIGLCVWNAARLSNVTAAPQNDEGINAAGGENSTDDTFCGNYWVIDENSNAYTDYERASSYAVDNIVSDNPIITTTVPDVMGMIVIDGEKYLQFATGKEAEAYTLDECIGSAEDFEGTYQTYLKDTAAKVYTVTEDSDVLIVKLGNGGTVALRKE